ncbi:MAG: beta-lactamase family protein, partial [Actinomycetota bacterium]|nr:beta-lactamase family protein [Actinomycetota bacterium]
MTREAVERFLERADELIVAAMNKRTTPGLGVGVVNGSVTLYVKGFGLADVEQGSPVTPKTVFRIGSITKTMTAVGLMRLWEGGRLDLDDPVNDYLRGYRVEHPDPAAPEVTFRHMLTHTSGIGELRKMTDLFRPMSGLGAKPDGPAPSPEEYYAGGLRPSVYPGTKWVYANHAYNVLGQLVEDISGVPFAGYMRENIFVPLGMKNTDYLRSERVREGLAQGYTFSRGRLKPVKYTEIVVKGAGSVFSSVDDMCRYVAALLRGGANEHGRVLGPETLSLMMEPHYRLDERLPAMGLAFLLDDFDGHLIVGHDGGWPGFLSSMLLCPGEELGVVVFANASSLAAQEAAQDLMGGDAGRAGAPLQAPEEGYPGVPPPLAGAARLLRAGGTAQHQLAGLAHVRRGAGGPRRGQPSGGAHARRSVPQGREALPHGSHRPVSVRSRLRRPNVQGGLRARRRERPGRSSAGWLRQAPETTHGTEPPPEGDGRVGRGSRRRPRHRGVAGAREALETVGGLR